ncbi:hypothetical protein SMICM17S_03931 [Streptomyces microflavus]
MPSSREATSRSPPGSAVSPQGDFSPSVSVETTVAEPLAGGRSADALGEGEPELREADGEAAPVPDGPSAPPEEARGGQDQRGRRQRGHHPPAHRGD